MAFLTICADAQIEVALPGTAVTFILAHEEQMGDCRRRSRYSPARQFVDQPAARVTAQYVMALLFAPDPGQQPDRGRRR